jgi:large subunit ribosomal protein L33
MSGLPRRQHLPPEFFPMHLQPRGRTCPWRSNMREKIKLVSSAGTGVFYTTTKNKKLSTEKLRLKKYDKKIRKHVEFVEEKLR